MIDKVKTRTSGRNLKIRMSRRSLNNLRTTIWPAKIGESAIIAKSNIFQPRLKNSQGFLP